MIRPASFGSPSPLPPPDRIDFETLRESPADLDLLSFRTRGRLIAASGEVLGVCFVTTHQRRAEAARLTSEAILAQLEFINEEDQALAAALAAWRPRLLEEAIDSSALVLVERIEVFGPASGSGLWRQLYFATLAAATARLAQRPANFFFKVFPLDYAGKLDSHPREAFRRAQRSLKLLYAVHLAAKTFGPQDDSACWMYAPLPS